MRIEFECTSFRVQTLAAGRLAVRLFNAECADETWDKVTTAKALRVTTRTLELYMGRAKDPIPYWKDGRRVRFDRKQVEAWVAEFDRRKRFGNFA